MEIKFGAYKIKTHELENKLSVQVTSDFGEVTMHEGGEGNHDFPNAVCCKINNPTKQIKPRGLKKFRFGDYKFILGINYSGDLVLFHSLKLNVARKVINNTDALTLSLLKNP